MNGHLKIVKQSFVEQDLQTLLVSQDLGVYNCVEVTEIFAIVNKGSQPINVFTLMVGEHRDPEFLVLDNASFITPREGIVLSQLKGWFIGIKTYLVSIGDAIDMFAIAESNGKWNSCGNTVNTAEYSYKSRIFTPPNSYETVPLNAVLKNNFNNGSYVVELINQHKNEFSIFFEKTTILQELSEGVLKYLPIDLSSLSDRLGSIIFQVPVNAIQTRAELLSDELSVRCKIAWHPKTNARDLIVCGYQEDDDFNNNDFHIVNCSKSSKSVTIPFNHKGAYRLTIWDANSKLILHSLAPSRFIKAISFSSNIIESEHRVIYHSNGSHSTVPVITHSDTKIIGDKKSKATDWTRARIYENNREKLRDNREFVQYNPKGKNKEAEHKKALSDLRFLINRYGENGVYLWDPYLSPSDIIETLFYTKFNNSKLRAITYLKEPPSEKKDKDKSVFDRYQHEFNSLAPEMTLGINLQLRSPRNNYGWSFHDRFLIFPNVNDLPVAWSLGTSVNSFGQEHHILQKCGDARLILDAFNELWTEIDKDDCLIWSSI